MVISCLAYIHYHIGNIYSAQWFHFINVETESQTCRAKSGVTFTNFETLAQMVASHSADSRNDQWFHAWKC